MADTNVGMTAIRTDYNADYTAWLIWAEFISAVNPTSVTSVIVGDEGSPLVIAAVTAAIAANLGVTGPEVIYVNPSTI